jgi:uncharacterized membrane-anchored protein
MKKNSLILLGVLVVAQLAVPFAMIKSRENVLTNGELYKFKTEPIDPADPFQGRYVWLAFEDDYIPASQEQRSDLHYGQTIYAQVAVGNDGFARFTDWSLKKPELGPYMKTRYQGIHKKWLPDTDEWEQDGFRIDMPFNRFYMDEEKAPRAEIIAREATRNTNCWASVRLLNGKTVIEDVLIEGQSIRDLAALHVE